VHGVRSHQRSTLSHLSIFRPKKESTEHPLAARREREVPMRPGSATRLVSHRPPGLRARRDRSAPGRVAPYGPTSTALLAPVACARAPVYRQRRRRTTRPRPRWIVRVPAAITRAVGAGRGRWIIGWLISCRRSSSTKDARSGAFIHALSPLLNYCYF
jgi:hypothetical protein